ncbi:MAG: glycosyltransferase family 4 protein [Acidobacteria bacterium]|nr:glycosyltransferase family 4 protein [Acidobacteriota bacterium]MCW5969769.1 glycosyltransferase family 4 protein [Blastocatellales bacterium]
MHMTKPVVVFTAARDPREGIGGHTSYVRVHARAALGAGFEPHIFCASSETGAAQTEFGIVHLVRTDFLPQRTIEAGLRKKLLFWTAPFVTAAIVRFLSTRQGPHLIHGITIWGYSGVAAAEKLLRRGVRTVVINSHYTTIEHEFQGKVRGVDRSYGQVQRLLYRAEQFWMERAIGRYERATYTRPHLLLVNYEAVRRRFYDQYGPGAQVRRVPYASEAAFLHEGRKQAATPPPALAALRPGDAPLIVSVSRHDPRKGIPVLLRALAGLRDRGVRFRACLVSGGEYFNANRRLAERLRLGDQITFTGWAPDPFDYLQHADVFVLPSLQEGSGSLAMLEAMQAGAAIVASDLDGIPEDVTDGESALLVEPGNVEALSRALHRIVTDAELRERLQQRARATFEARFSAAALTDALRDIYAELGFTAAPSKSPVQEEKR